jgi:UDP-N-acetylmuramoyl-tripeptide--D-alanyl-D-alanine ligase
MIKPIVRRLVARKLERQVARLIEATKPYIVAVTGSVGKTSTKLAVARLLQAGGYRVLVHEGNYNSELGLPLAIFGQEAPRPVWNLAAWRRIYRLNEAALSRAVASREYDVWVLEMGAEQPGDIVKFMKYIRPDLGIITSIKAAHLEGFGHIAKIAAEKMALAAGSKTALLNADDGLVMMERPKLDVPTKTYGLKNGDFRFQNNRFAFGAGYMGVLNLAGAKQQVTIPVLGEHSLYPAVAAAAASAMIGLKSAEIAAALPELKPVAGRMNLLAGKNDSYIIDDSYNSSPEAAVAALETLYQLPGKRKLAILGSMNELGDYTEAGHQLVGQTAAKVDLLATIGAAAADYLASAAQRAGLAAAKIKTFTRPWDAGTWIASQMTMGDVVLVKGSQNGVFAEEAVATLLTESADRSKLVRQSPEWQAKKRQQFGDQLGN